LTPENSVEDAKNYIRKNVDSKNEDRDISPVLAQRGKKECVEGEK
jgi:hypothetical protein